MQPRPRKKYWYKGKVLYTNDILKKSGVRRATYEMRIRRGWSRLLALTTPVSSDAPEMIDSDLIFELEPIVEGEFYRKAQEVVAVDDSRIHVYQEIRRSGRPITKRWLGEKGFQRFISDMGERPLNTVFLVRDNKKMLSAENCYWGKEK